MVKFEHTFYNVEYSCSSEGRSSMGELCYCLIILFIIIILVEERSFMGELYYYLACADFSP